MWPLYALASSLLYGAAYTLLAHLSSRVDKFALNMLYSLILLAVNASYFNALKPTGLLENAAEVLGYLLLLTFASTLRGEGQVQAGVQYGALFTLLSSLYPAVQWGLTAAVYGGGAAIRWPYALGGMGLMTAGMWVVAQA
jgi:hypothetical protein